MYLINMNLLTLCIEAASPPRAVKTSRSCFLLYVCPVIIKQLKTNKSVKLFWEKYKTYFWKSAI